MTSEEASRERAAVARRIRDILPELDRCIEPFQYTERPLEDTGLTVHRLGYYLVGVDVPSPYDRLFSEFRSTTPPPGEEVAAWVRESRRLFVTYLNAEILQRWLPALQGAPASFIHDIRNDIPVAFPFRWFSETLQGGG